MVNFAKLKNKNFKTKREKIARTVF